MSLRAATFRGHFLFSSSSTLGAFNAVYSVISFHWGVLSVFLSFGHWHNRQDWLSRFIAAEHMNKQKKEIKIYSFVKAGRGQSNKQDPTGPQAIISCLRNMKNKGKLKVASSTKRIWVNFSEFLLCVKSSIWSDTNKKKWLYCICWNQFKRRTTLSSTVSRVLFSLTPKCILSVDWEMKKKKKDVDVVYRWESVATKTYSWSIIPSGTVSEMYLVWGIISICCSFSFFHLPLFVLRQVQAQWQRKR